MSDGSALFVKPEFARAAIRTASVGDAAEGRWPATVRLMVLAGGSVASWALMLGLVAQI